MIHVKAAQLLTTERVKHFAGWSLPLLVCLTIAFIPAETYIVNLVTDDALYYPTIARSIASGLGSTYDGITRTNGYHPLWCWLQVPIAALVGRFEPLGYLWFVKLFMSIIAALALYVWNHLIRRVTGSDWLSATFVLLLGSYWWSIYTLYSGMETPLVILLMGVCLMLTHRLLFTHSLTHSITLGMAMAATFLARLDSVFFLGVLGGVVLVALRHHVRLLIAWILPAVLLPLPYLWWNLSNFGNIVPVSGIKKSVSSLNLNAQWSILANFWSDKLTKLAGFLHPTGVALLLIAVSAGLYFGRRELRDLARRLNILWVLPIGALLHYGYTSIFMVEADVYWYQYSEYLTAFMLLALVVASMVAWLRARVKFRIIQCVPFVAVFLSILTVLMLYASRKLPNQVSVNSYRTAVWARDHMGTSDLRYGMVDSGVFRFVSGFKTIPLNGLAGDQELLKLVRRGHRSEIIRRYRINYIVKFFPNEEINKIPAQYIVFQSDAFSYVKPGRMLIVDSAYWIAFESH